MVLFGKGADAVINELMVLPNYVLKKPVKSDLSPRLNVNSPLCHISLSNKNLSYKAFSVGRTE